MYLIILLSVILIVIVYRIVIKPNSYWKERGVPYQKPWPILGNMAGVFFRRQSLFEQAQDFYNQFPGKRYGGVFQFMKPMLLIRDLDLIKRITIKDFDHFQDHNAAFVEHDPLMGRHLFALKGQKWRDMRATISPSFTSSKMRYMFAVMVESVENFLIHLEKKADPDMYVAEARDLFQRFTNDAIASVVFGYNCDSIADPDNQFYVMGKEVTNFSGRQLTKFLILTMFPSLGKLLDIRLFSEKMCNFFRSVVKDNVEKREKDGVVRPDMIQILMDARSGQSVKYPEPVTENTHEEGFAVVEESTLEGAKVHQRAAVTDEDIAAQAFIFFTAGFDAVSILMCFISYELALNVDIQEKLQAEIDETLHSCNGKITYNALLGIKYLDMVISETLRKWGLAPQSDRVCVKDYEIKPVNPDEKTLVIEKGTTVLISIRGIHFDPDYYPDPEKFDPERFSEENMKNIQQFTYMPFGVGPRNCIANRFALLKAKTLMFLLLSKFSIEVVEKTPIPLVISRKSFSLVPDEGFWLGFKLRKPTNMQK